MFLKICVHVFLVYSFIRIYFLNTDYYLTGIAKYLALILLTGFIPLSFFSQKIEIDSLLKVIRVSKEDTAQVTRLNDVGSLYEDVNDLKNARASYDKALALAQKLNFKKGIAINLYDIGGLYYDESSYNDALDHFSKALDINLEMLDSTRIGDCYNMMGDVYRKQAKYPKALDCLLKGLKLREAQKQTKRIASSNNNIGLVYLEIDNFTKALEYFEKALKSAKESNNKFTICRCYNRMAIVYNELGQNDKAMEYYQLSLKTATEVDDKTVMWIASGNIGNLYAELNKYDEALEAYKKSCDIATAIGNREGLCSSYRSMGYLDIKKKDYKSAEEYFRKAEKLALELELNDALRDVYEGLYHINEGKGNYREALMYHVKFKALTDSIYNVDNTKQMSDLKTQFEVDKKEGELKAQAAAQLAISVEEKKRQQMMIYSVVAVLIIVVLFSLFMYKRLIIIRKQKLIIESQKSEVDKQRELADSRRIIAEEQRYVIEEKQKEILDSIAYAKRLQQAILPSTDFINEHVPGNFVFYKPKDIVAGDFYWAESISLPEGEGRDEVSLFFIAAADCTGHGVPGALVSVVCSNALNRSVKEFHLTETGSILDKTRELVLETFEKSYSGVKDGMDISLLCIDKKGRKVFWSGANNPLWYIEESQQNEIKANKQPIGKTENPAPFTTHTIEYKENTIFYLITDGYADQFGGPKGKKIKHKYFYELLFKNHQLSMEEQAKIIEQSFEDWRGALEQIDDICIIGIRL